MSLVKYWALRGSRAGGLFPASGKLYSLVRSDLRIPGLGGPSWVLGSRQITSCWCPHKDPLEGSPPGPLKSALRQVPAPGAVAFIPLSFMIPAMRLGRSCSWMFQTFLYRHRICGSGGGDRSQCAEGRRTWQGDREGCCRTTD